ncbi:KIAA1328 [Branchiostoma lanceolatum]|uniref:KIAA1328 protein n=1 Tax=Branchiostoma lanceolatum TaxID=7740 RepID=A0A8K0EKU8_BRALA|nr:KIAA1328 [Branchiostoma lanceolatum]
MAAHLRPYEVFWTKDVTDEENSLVHVPGVTDVGNKRPQKKMPGRRSRDLDPRMPSPTAHSTPEREDGSALHSGIEAEDSGKVEEDSVIKQQKEKVIKNGSSESKKPALKDLRIEDKKRVANLIKELAKVGEEKEKAVETLQTERQTYGQKLQLLEQEHQKTLQAIQDQYHHLATERDHIQSRAAMAEQQYQETQALLTLYQRQITEQQEMVNEKLNESLNELLSSPRRLSPKVPETPPRGAMPASTVGFTPPQRLDRGVQNPVPQQRYANLYTPQVNMVQPGAEVSSRGISHMGPTTLVQQGESDLSGSYRPKERRVPSRDVIYSDGEDTVYTGKYAVHYYLEHPERIQSNLPPGVLPSQRPAPPQYNSIIPPGDPETHSATQSSVISSVHSSTNHDLPRPLSFPAETFLTYSSGQQSSSQYSSTDFQPLEPEPDFDSQRSREITSQKRTELYNESQPPTMPNGHGHYYRAEPNGSDAQVHHGVGTVHDGKGGPEVGLSRQQAWEHQREQLMDQKRRLIEEQERLRTMLAAQEDQLNLKRAQLHRQQVRHKGRLQYFEEMGRFPSDSSVASSVHSSLASVDHKLPRAPASRPRSQPRQPSRTSKETGRRRNAKYQQQQLSTYPRMEKPSRESAEPLDWDHTYDYSHPTYIQTNVSQETGVSDRSSLRLGYRDGLPGTDMSRYDQRLHVDTDGTSDQVSSQELSPPSTKYPPSEPGFKSPTRLTKHETPREPETLQEAHVNGTTADIATSPAYTESSVQTDGGSVSVGTSPVHFSQMGTQSKKRPSSAGSFLSSLVDIVDLVDRTSVTSEPTSLGSHSGRRHGNRATPSYLGNKSSRPNSRQRPWTAPSSEKKGVMGHGRTVPLGRKGVSKYDRTVPFGREGVTGYDGGISPDMFADDEEDESITEQESRILEEVFFLK